MKYSEDKIVILSLLILGNSFPTTEHPFETDKNGNIIYETQNKRGNGKIEQNQNESKASIDGFYGRPLQQGYQSHLTLGSFSFFLSFFKNQQWNKFSGWKRYQHSLSH